MNRLTVTLMVSFFLISFSCNSQRECNLKEVRTLFTIPGVYNGKVEGYSHYVLIKDFSRKCLDSTTIVNLALKYCDTVKIGRPVDVLMFFDSDKNFIPNETSQDMEEINKSCIVVIGFDERTRKPNDFIFYDDKGDRTYWGARWLPNSDKKKEK